MALGTSVRKYQLILRLGSPSIVLTVGLVPYPTLSDVRGGYGLPVRRLWGLAWEEVMGTSLGGGYGH